MRYLAPALLAATSLASTTLQAQVWGRSHDYTADRSVSQSASGARTVRVLAAAGSLRIEGRSGLSEVRAHGTAFASRREILSDVKLTVKRTGDAVEVAVEMPDFDRMARSRSWDNWEAGLDLVVEVPSSLALDVDDTSGDLEIRDVASLDLHDSSGDIRINGIAGDVRISDNSGGIYVENVRGNLDMPHDGSGSVEIRHVGGTVHIGSKGSGSVEAVDVGRDLVVDHKGSGSIDYRDVRGNVDVPERHHSRRSRR